MKYRLLLWVTLAFCAVPFGHWLGDKIYAARQDALFGPLRKKQELDREYMAGFNAALEKKREQENAVSERQLEAALEHLKQVEREVYGN